MNNVTISANTIDSHSPLSPNIKGNVNNPIIRAIKLLEEAITTDIRGSFIEV